MQKRDELARRALEGLLMNELAARSCSLAELGANIVRGKGDVVYAFSVLL